MHTGFAQPSFGYKTSSRRSMRHASPKKHGKAYTPHPKAPLHSRAEASHFTLTNDELHTIAEKAAKKVAVENRLNTQPVHWTFPTPYAPSERPRGLFGSLKETTGTFIQVVKDVATLAALGAAGYVGVKYGWPVWKSTEGVRGFISDHQEVIKGVGTGAAVSGTYHYILPNFLKQGLSKAATSALGLGKDYGKFIFRRVAKR